MNSENRINKTEKTRHLVFTDISIYGREGRRVLQDKMKGFTKNFWIQAPQQNTGYNQNFREDSGSPSKCSTYLREDDSSNHHHYHGGHM